MKTMAKKHLPICIVTSKTAKRVVNNQFAMERGNHKLTSILGLIVAQYVVLCHKSETYYCQVCNVCITSDCHRRVTYCSVGASYLMQFASGPPCGVGRQSRAGFSSYQIKRKSRRDLRRRSTFSTANAICRYTAFSGLSL